MHGPRKNPLVWDSWPPKSKRPAVQAPAGEETKEESIADPYSAAPQVEDQAGAYEQAEAEPAAPADADPESSASSPDSDRIFPFTGPPHHSPTQPVEPPYPEMELARAYIPYQSYGPTYTPAEALEKGTLFPDLYRPYPY